MTHQQVTGTGRVRWWLPLVIGVSLTLAAAFTLHWHNQRAIRMHANALAEEAGATVQERFNRFEYGLRGARGAIITRGIENITREHFETYINSREQAREFPGALGFGFIRRVPQNQESSFLAQARADGAPDFTIRSLNPNLDDRFIIQYIYPERGNEQAVGLDIGSEANRRSAALAAARDGQPRLTAPITLVQADGKPRRGFLVLLPIYPDQALPQTPEEREKTVAGWAYAPLVVDDVLADMSPRMAQVAITLTYPGEPEPFYRSPSADATDLVSQRVTLPFLVMGERWQLELTAKAGVVEGLKLWSYWWVVVLGLGLTCLVLWGSHLWNAHLLAMEQSDGLSKPGTPGLKAFLTGPLFRRSWPPVLLAITLIFGLASWLLVQHRLGTERRGLVEANNAALGYLEDVATKYRRNVIFLASTPPVEALKQQPLALDGPVNGPSSQQWKARLADIFEAFMLATPEVHQVRLIEADSGWREGVKVQRSGDQLQIFEADALQDKRNEPYIADALRVGRGKTHVSELNLNREFGIVERPYRPVWRFATPVYRADGRPFGIVIINVSADRLLASAAAKVSEETEFYITNSDGGFLWHPQPARAFGFEFGLAQRWLDEFTPAPWWPGLGIGGLGRWQSQEGYLWARQGELFTDAKSQQVALRVLTVTPEFPVFESLIIQLGGLLLTLLTLGLVGGVLQHRVWWDTQKRQWRLRAQQLEIQRNNETTLFKALVESAPDATLIVNESGIIELANVQAERLFGYLRSEMEGSPVHKLLPSRFAEQHQAQLANFMEHPKTRVMGNGKDLRAQRADGREFPADVTLGPVQLDDRMLVSASVRDVSERLAIDAQLRTALQDAEQATEAKSAFLANTSHEIRTPLNAIIGLTHLLAEEPLTGPQQQLVQKIQVSGRSLLGIVNDVLDLSKIEANEMAMEQTPVELRELLEEVGSMFAPQTEAKNIQYRLEVDDQLPRWVITDSTRLSQILVNLLSNALKFTNIGQIKLQAEQRPASPTQPEDCVNLRLTVADTGIGISAEAQGRLFQPFSQADASTTRHFGGTGLGLSIVRKLAGLMGGEVGVHSQEGSGSQFYLDLPLRIASAVEIASQDHQSSALFVLSAEDDPADAKQLQLMTRALGWRSQVVSDGAELIDAYVKRKTSGLRLPDALIVDWQMPNLDGLAAIERLAEQVGREALPAVLVISAHEDQDFAALDPQHLTRRVLHKPVDASTLFNAVNEVVTQQTGDNQRVLQSTRTEVVKALWLPGVRVLVVDDSAINLDVVSQILHRNGARVEVAHSGQAALDLLIATPEAFDAVLMDVQMPGMDGLETTQKIRKELGLQSLPIIALTAGALVEERRRAFEFGMNDFLTKPIDPSLLINRLRMAVEAYQGKTLTVEALQRGAAEDPQWPDVPGLNHAQARRLLMDDPQMFLMALSRLLQEHANLAQSPPEMVDQVDAGEVREQIAAQVHKLRSAAGMVGAERLQELASRAEKTLRAPDQLAYEVLVELSQELDQLGQASAPALQAWSRSRESAPINPLDDAPEPVLAPDQFKQLLNLLAANDLAALDLAAEHRAALGAALGDGVFQQLHECMQALDFKGAIALLEPFSDSDWITRS